VVHAEIPVEPRYLVPDPASGALVQVAAAHACGAAPGIAVTHAVVTGDVTYMLEAESRAADLIVVGSRGKGRVLGLLLGSTRLPWPPSAIVR
jgi:nucleotide-binding universal stress UspA family protein